MTDLQEGLRLAELGREQEMAGNVEDRHAVDWASWAAFHGTFLIQRILKLEAEEAEMRQRNGVLQAENDGFKARMFKGRRDD